MAVFTQDGQLIWSGQDHAPHAASGACMRLLSECEVQTGAKVREGALFIADLGPGSFTGVRVGIVLAKAFAYLNKVECAGAVAFDLINPTGIAFVPSRKNEVFIRMPGDAPTRDSVAPHEALGYGISEREANYPLASNFRPLLEGLIRMQPVELVPAYFAEPSISLPKRAYSREVGSS